MAEARAQGRVLMLAMACLLGFSGSLASQTPVWVDQRSIPPSLTGELGESDVARAVAMIRDLSTTYGVLAEREIAAEDRARWEIFRRAYLGAANRLEAMRAGGQITFRDLPDGESVSASSSGIVLDSTLAGGWQPDVVLTNRRIGAGDWADISRLAGILMVQQALVDASGIWDEWSAAHANFQNLVGEEPDQTLQPLLMRFWHIQDKYLANSQVQNATGAGRAASLSNEMLALLSRVESAGGWRWRKALETVWDERDSQATAIAARAIAVPGPIPAATPSPLTPAKAVPPRSADFDKLFAGPEPVPLVTAAGPVEDLDRPVEDISARADIDALYRENSSRVQVSQNLAKQLGDLSSQVEVLAESVAEQGRSLETLTGDVAITRTIPKALEALTASQSALERRLADLSREVGPEGLSSQLAALKAAMDTAQNQSQAAAQRLEARVQARVQARLRALDLEVEAAQHQANELQSKLLAFRPSVAAVEISLQDEAVRQIAFWQTISVGIALMALFLAAIAFWVRGARQQAGNANSADEAMDHKAPDQSELRDELTQLRADIESERIRAADLDGRLTRTTAQLTDSQARAKRLAAKLATELATVRVNTQTVGRGLLDSAARDVAMGDELTGLRQVIEVERARSRDTQALVDELRSPHNGEDATPETANHHMVQPAIVDIVERRRAIEALQHGDLPGFEQAFAQLTSLPLNSVERIVRHSSGQDLALVCRAVGIAKPHIAAILILSRRAQPDAQSLANRLSAPQQLAEAIAAYDESSTEVATRTLRDWRMAGQ